jgi:hypothetical protein
MSLGESSGTTQGPFTTGVLSVALGGSPERRKVRSLRGVLSVALGGSPERRKVRSLRGVLSVALGGSPERRKVRSLRGVLSVALGESSGTTQGPFTTVPCVVLALPCNITHHDLL